MDDLQQIRRQFINAYISYEKIAGGNNIPKHVSLFDLSLFLSFREWDSKKKVDLPQLILNKFKVEDIWFFASSFGTCTCCDKCACKLKTKIPPTRKECKCQCWSLYNLFVRALMKDKNVTPNYSD